MNRSVNPFNEHLAGAPQFTSPIGVKGREGQYIDLGNAKALEEFIASPSNEGKVALSDLLYGPTEFYFNGSEIPVIPPSLKAESRAAPTTLSTDAKKIRADEDFKDMAVDAGFDKHSAEFQTLLAGFVAKDASFFHAATQHAERMQEYFKQKNQHPNSLMQIDSIDISKHGSGINLTIEVSLIDPDEDSENLKRFYRSPVVVDINAPKKQHQYPSIRVRHHADQLLILPENQTKKIKLLLDELITTVEEVQDDYKDLASIKKLRDDIKNCKTLSAHQMISLKTHINQVQENVCHEQVISIVGKMLEIFKSAPIFRDTLIKSTVAIASFFNKRNQILGDAIGIDCEMMNPTTVGQKSNLETFQPPNQSLVCRHIAGGKLPDKIESRALAAERLYAHAIEKREILFSYKKGGRTFVATPPARTDFDNNKKKEDALNFHIWLQENTIVQEKVSVQKPADQPQQPNSDSASELQQIEKSEETLIRNSKCFEYIIGSTFKENYNSFSDIATFNASGLFTLLRGTCSDSLLFLPWNNEDGTGGITMEKPAAIDIVENNQDHCTVTHTSYFHHKDGEKKNILKLVQTFSLEVTTATNATTTLIDRHIEYDDPNFEKQFKNTRKNDPAFREGFQCWQRTGVPFVTPALRDESPVVTSSAPMIPSTGTSASVSEGSSNSSPVGGSATFSPAPNPTDTEVGDEITEENPAPEFN